MSDSPLSCTTRKYWCTWKSQKRWRLISKDLHLIDPQFLQHALHILDRRHVWSIQSAHHERKIEKDVQTIHIWNDLRCCLHVLNLCAVVSRKLLHTTSSSQKKFNSQINLQWCPLAALLKCARISWYKVLCTKKNKKKFLIP